MNQSPEILSFPTERLKEELLAKAAELQRLHNSGLVSEGGTKWFRPTTELREKINSIRQEGARILRELRPLLDPRGIQQLELLIADKWAVQQFDKENDEQQPTAYPQF